jgi:hypothetical protein
MTSRDRQRRRAPQVETLEDKALLSTVTVFPFGRPTRARTYVVPTATAGGTQGTTPTTGTGAASGVGTITNGSGGNGPGAVGNNGAAGSTTVVAPTIQGLVVGQFFRRRGGHAFYDLLEVAGPRTYESTFVFDVRHVGPQPAAPSVTAASAFDLLVNRLASAAGTTAPNLGTTPSPGDYTIESERLFPGKTLTVYDLKIRSGDVVISEQYKLTKSSSGLITTSSFTKADAFADFVIGFTAKAAASGVNSGSL